MKIAIGIIVGAALTIGGTAFAYETSQTISKVTSYQGISKFYDSADDVVCYTLVDTAGRGISCLHP